MSVHIRNSLFALGILTLVSLACVYLLPDEKYYYPDPEVEVSGDILAQWDATATAAAAATRAARPTLAVDSPSAGGCYWRNSEIAPPADTTSNPNMDIEVSEPMSVFTKLKHGVSGCAEQYFYTQHRWTFSSVMRPGESQKLQVVFEWLNDGTADCSALVAGGVTSLTVGDVKLRAENMSINVKTDPRGEVSDSTTWVVPQGEVGDRFTITVHSSSGSYGSNARYHFEYVCD